MEGFNIIDDDRCENLRWKGLYLETQPIPGVPQADHIYWCLKTQINLGPDGNLVDQYECNPARPCYRAL
jgi:hypothetical protein